ncbi:hypothetical protein [Sphingomonas sp.]|uniref:DUF7064 domain-containing protein n=1 Tax=Sphingomonas sp. TaxID=28214 RepID=UPI00325FBF91
MITADDFGFHPCDPADRSWTETLFMIFSVPEAGISGNLYTLARPNLGICHSSIEIHKGMCFHPWQIHHNDAQMHLACPEKFDDFTLENGLSFKAHNARDSEFSYDSLDGKCQLKLSFEAVCDPFDPHDPEQVPSLGKGKVAGYDGWNNGHMESKGRIRGSLTLRGKTYAVDCIDGMDKSWGPRRDWGNKGATWVQVDLGEDLGAFLVLGLSFENKEVKYGPFNYGFLAIDGERRPIVSASMTAQRSDMLVTRADVKFEDDQGNSYHARGTTIAAGPWYNFNPSSAAFQTLMRWESGTRVGHSHIADFAGLSYLSEGMSDNFADELDQ